MQFTGHSLPVHQSMSVPWEFFFTSSHFVSQFPPTRFPLITAIRMCHFLPVHHLGMAFLAGSNAKIQHNTSDLVTNKLSLANAFWFSIRFLVGWYKNTSTASPKGVRLPPKDGYFLKVFYTRFYRIRIILYRSIWPIDRTLTSTNTPSQSGTGSNSYKGLYHPQSSKTGDSLPDAVYSHTQDTSILAGEGLFI